MRRAVRRKPHSNNDAQSQDSSTAQTQPQPSTASQSVATLYLTALDVNAPGGFLDVMSQLPSGQKDTRPRKFNSNNSTNTNNSDSSNNDASNSTSSNDSKITPTKSRVTVKSRVRGVIKLQDKLNVSSKSNFELDLGGSVLFQGAGLHFDSCSNFKISNVLVDVGSSAVLNSGVDGSSLDCMTLFACSEAEVCDNELFHSTDETFTIGQGCNHVNFHHNIIAYPMDNTKLHDGEHHAYATCFISDKAGDENVFHHNLVVSCLSRMPRFDGDGGVDFSNNVIVNPGQKLGYNDPDSATKINYHDNWIYSGPDTTDGIALLLLNGTDTVAWCSNNRLDNQPYAVVKTKSGKKGAASNSVTSAKRNPLPWCTPLAGKSLANAGALVGYFVPKTDLASDTLAFVKGLVVSPSRVYSNQFRIQSQWTPVSLV